MVLGFQQREANSSGIAMGTCMSKDKKGATSAAHTASASTSSSSSLSSQGKQIGYSSKNNDSNMVRPSHAEENLPNTIARPSSVDEGKEPTSTDKHVVEIRLPIASPSKFMASSASVTLAARAMAAIAKPAVEERASAQNQEEEEAEEAEAGVGGGGAYCDSKGPSKLRNPSPPLFYSSYLSRASFSRDLAAFSRDIASLSASPLMRSPSVNGAHDLIAAAIKAAHSPLYAQAKSPSNMVFDDYSTTTRSRSLPKRFYGKDSNSNRLPLHKRSTSRDAGIEHRKPMKRKPLVDPPGELALSPRLSVRREEASGEYRVCARQAAARKGHHQYDAHVTPSKTPDMGLPCKKERSPLRRSSTGKVGDADKAYQDFPHFQENQNSTQPLPCGSTILNQSRGRPALVERSTNCSSWAAATNLGVQGAFKDFKELTKVKVEQNDENVGVGRSISEIKLFEEGFQEEATQSECPNSSMYYSSKPRLSTRDQSDTIVMSMERLRSIFELLTDLNLESSLFSEVEESETEVEGELDLLQFAFHDEISPRQERQAQQTRNMLLKEAAMDAFARPNFHSSMHTEGLDEGQVPSSDLVALMSMRLTEAEVDTLKIRKVLKLLSMAESEMGKEQKTLYYNQLRMVLDSVKTQDEKNSQTGVSLAGNLKEKAVNARANSWPRSVKEPAHIVMTVESSSNQVSNETQTQKLSLKANNGITALPSVTQLQEELCLGHPESMLQAIGPCELHDLQVSVQKTGVDLEYPHPEKLSSELCHAHQANEHNIVHQVDESSNVDLSSAQRSCAKQGLVREDDWGAEILNKSASQQALDGMDNLLTEDVHDERGTDEDAERAACNSSNHGVVERTLLITRVLYQPQSTPFQVCSREEFQCEGVACAVEVETNCPTPLYSPAGVEVQLDAHMGPAPTAEQDARGFRSCEDAPSDASFEFRVKSSSVSTPSTPLISTASTPRHLSPLVPPLTAQAIAEIWEAFE